MGRGGGGSLRELEGLMETVLLRFIFGGHGVGTHAVSGTALLVSGASPLISAALPPQVCLASWLSSWTPALPSCWAAWARARRRWAS